MKGISILYCKTCKLQSSCQAICKLLSNHLDKKSYKRGYSARHIRRKEIPYSYEGLLFLEKLNVRMGKG